MMAVLFRHGPAGTSAPGAADEARRLTPEGRRKTRAAAHGLRGLIPAPRAIVSSPLARARETAEILADVLPGRRRVRLDDRLRPGAAPLAWRALADEFDPGPVVLVGHEPHLSTLACRWLGAPPGAIELKKAGACALDAPPGARRAALVWLATPRSLRRLGA